MSWIPMLNRGCNLAADGDGKEIAEERDDERDERIDRS